MSIHIGGITAGEAANMTWSGPPAQSVGQAMTAGALQADGKYLYSYTLPAGTAFSTGATTFTVTVPASGTHQLGTFVQTFNVTQAKNKTKC